MLYGELEDYITCLFALVRRVVSINYDETTSDIIVTERSLVDIPKEYVYVEENLLAGRFKPDVLAKLKMVKTNEGVLLYRISIDDFYKLLITSFKSNAFNSIMNELEPMITSQDIIPIVNIVNNIRSRENLTVPIKEFVNRLSNDSLKKIVSIAWSKQAEVVEMYLTPELLTRNNIVKYKRMAYNQLIELGKDLKGGEGYVYIYAYTDGVTISTYKVFEKSGKMFSIDQNFTEKEFSFDTANHFPLDDLIIMVEEMKEKLFKKKKAEKEKA